MQTFLPYPDFAESAKVLDPSRLGNQFYREGLTLLRGGWGDHPAARMWVGHEYALCLYLMATYVQLLARGKFYPEAEGEIRQTMRQLKKAGACMDYPEWLGDERLHSSHRGVLLAKDPVWYGRFGWTERPLYKVDNKWPYWWPTEEKA